MEQICAFCQNKFEKNNWLNFKIPYEFIRIFKKPWMMIEL